MGARSVPPLGSGQIKRLAEVLAEVTTGGELDRVLAETRLPASDISTKWRRLRDSFDRAQAASRSANPVLKFTKVLLEPSGLVADAETSSGPAGRSTRCSPSLGCSSSRMVGSYR